MIKLNFGCHIVICNETVVLSCFSLAARLENFLHDIVADIFSFGLVTSPSYPAYCFKISTAWVEEHLLKSLMNVYTFPPCPLEKSYQKLLSFLTEKDGVCSGGSANGLIPHYSSPRSSRSTNCEMYSTISTDSMSSWMSNAEYVS